MESEWKIIPGCKRFEINREGIVRNRRPDKKAVPWTYCTNGYPQVSIATDAGKRTTRTVHKLVATSFLRPLLPGEEINHKDTKRHNPRLDNLEILPTHGDHGKLHRTRIYGTCLTCGKEVQPLCKYCSYECRHKALWIIQTCKTCGGNFEIRKSLLTRHDRDPRFQRNGIYCSNGCKLSDPDFYANLKVPRKVSVKQVFGIKARFPLISQRELAMRFSVSQATIGKILRAETCGEVRT